MGDIILTLTFDFDFVSKENNFLLLLVPPLEEVNLRIRIFLPDRSYLPKAKFIQLIDTTSDHFFINEHIEMLVFCINNICLVEADLTVLWEVVGVRKLATVYHSDLSLV